MQRAQQIRAMLAVLFLIYSSLVQARGYYYDDSYHGNPVGYFDQFAYKPRYLTYPKMIRVDNVYWSRWTNTGYNCRSSCLINSYTGKAIRCERRCRSEFVWLIQ